jgi:hypothetical protein
MAALREVVASFDVRVEGAQKLDDVDKKLNKAKSSANGAMMAFGKFGAALAGAFAIREMAGFLSGQAKLGRELEMQAHLTGMSVEQLQRWQYAANQAGVGSEELTTGLNRFNRAIGMTGTEQDKSISQTLGKMGVSARDANGKIKNTNELLLEFADGLSKVKSPQERMAMAMEIAGRGGAKFVEVLGKGRAATEAMLKEADATGGVLGRDFVDSAKKAETAGIKLDWSWRGLKATLAQQLFPWLDKIVVWVQRFVKGFTDIVKHTTFAKTAFIALAVAIALANWEIVLIIAAATALYVAFDDVFNLFAGNKSYIGTTIDELNGAGTAADMAHDLADAWNEVKDAIFGTSEAGDAAGESLSWIGILKGNLAQTMLIVGNGLTFIASELAVVVNTAKLAWAAVTGKDTTHEDNALRASWTTNQKAAKDFFTHASPDEVLHLNANSQNMSQEDWYNLNHLSKMKTPKSIGKDSAAYAGVGGANRGSVVVHNHIDARGGDPKKIQAAVRQGTDQAISQNDLRHAQQASLSRAPAVNNNGPGF